MSRKRKTLKQKRMLDLKKNTSASDSASNDVKFTYSVDTAVKNPPAQTQNINTTSTISHFHSQDIKKSLLLTFFLVIINTVIFILLKNNIIPMSILGLE